MSAHLTTALAWGLSLLACWPTSSQADTVGGVHAVFEEDYQSARLTEAQLAKSRDICRRLFNRDLEVRGDTTLVGKATVEQYFSADGSRRSTIRRRSLNLSKDPCVVDIQPITEKKLYDYAQGVIYRYNSNHKRPWTKQRVMSTDKAGLAADAIAQSELLPQGEARRPLGKETIAGVSCEVHRPTDGMTVCAWRPAVSDPSQHPRLLNLSYRIEHQDGLVDTGRAVSVNLRAAINAELLLPPPEALAAK